MIKYNIVCLCFSSNTYPLAGMCVYLWILSFQVKSSFSARDARCQTVRSKQAQRRRLCRLVARPWQLTNIRRATKCVDTSRRSHIKHMLKNVYRLRCVRNMYRTHQGIKVHAVADVIFFICILNVLHTCYVALCIAFTLSLDTRMGRCVCEHYQVKQIERNTK